MKQLSQDPETDGIHSHCPLAIQRRQLQKDIDDFHILDKRQDAHLMQRIIERVEHMAMFDRNRRAAPLNSLAQSPSPRPSMPIPIRMPVSMPCSYRVW